MITFPLSSLNVPQGASLHFIFKKAGQEQVHWAHVIDTNNEKVNKTNEEKNKK